MTMSTTICRQECSQTLLCVTRTKDPIKRGPTSLVFIYREADKLFGLNVRKNINSRVAIPLCTFYRYSYSIGVFTNIGELLSYEGYHNKHENGVEDEVDEEKRNIERSSRLLGLLTRKQNCTDR